MAYWRSTVGDREQHSPDNKTYILHAGERRWDVVVKGALQESTGSRELARHSIRALKVLPRNQLPHPPPLRFTPALLAAILVGASASRTA